MGRKTTGYLFLRGDTWYLQWRAKGKTFVQSTGETDRGQAEKARARILTPIQLSDRTDGLRLIAARISDTQAATTAAMANAVSWADGWGAYMASPDCSDAGPTTMQVYREQWQRFTKWAEAEKIANPGATTAEQARRYSELLIARVGNKTHNSNVVLLRALWRALGLPSDVWSGIRRRRQQTHSRRELTLPEFRSVINSSAGELRTLLIIGAYTGLRLGDAATLLWSEVDLERGMICRIPNKTKRSGKPVRVPLHPDLRAELGAAGAGLVLPETGALYKHCPPTLCKHIHERFTACGIVTGAKGKVDVSFHSLRHTFVSLCRGADVPLVVVEAIVGHTNPAMTRHYSHTGDAAAAAAIASLPSLSGEAPVKREPLPAWATRLIKTLTPANCKTLKTKLLR